MKKIINYVIPRPFNGFNIPIAIQSVYLRDYCKRKNYIFSLPATEFTKTDSYAMLSSLIEEKKQGIMDLFLDLYSQFMI